MLITLNRSSGLKNLFSGSDYQSFLKIYHKTQMLQQKDNRSSGLKNLFSGSELSKFFKNLSQNPDVATKR